MQLAGRLFGPDDATAGVVLAHMLPADQTSWFDFADRLGELGYRVLTFDFRGYCPGGDAGCSEGQKDATAIWQDVAAPWAFLRIAGRPPDRRWWARAWAAPPRSSSASQSGTAIEAVVTLSAPDVHRRARRRPRRAAGRRRRRSCSSRATATRRGRASAQTFYDESRPAQAGRDPHRRPTTGPTSSTGNQGEIARRRSCIG